MIRTNGEQGRRRGKFGSAEGERKIIARNWNVTGKTEHQPGSAERV